MESAGLHAKKYWKYFCLLALLWADLDMAVVKNPIDQSMLGVPKVLKNSMV